MPDTSYTSATQVRHEQHKCDTNDTSATRVKNLDFDNDTSKNIFSHPYIYYMASERLQGEEQFQRKVFSLNQMSDICEVWKYWPLKDGFRLISQKLYILLWVDQKNLNF